MANLPDGRLLYRLAAADTARNFYHFDEMGNTLYLTDDGGTVVASYAYTPFGRLLESTGTLDNPFTWQGRHGVMADGNDLYYMRTRYYDGRLGRFLSRDGARSISPLGINPYQYANANPLRYVDRTGLTPEELAEMEAAWQRKQAQTVYIHAKGPEAGKMAFVQFLLGMDLHDILKEKPVRMKRLQLDLEDFDPPADAIESVLPELTPIIVDYAGNAIVADNAYLPRQGRETKRVETSARDAVVAKGVLPEFRILDPFSDLFGKNGRYSLLALEPAPSASPATPRISRGVPGYQIEQLFRAFFDWLLMPWGLDSGIYDPIVPPQQSDEEYMDSVVPELTPIVVIS